jgi:glycosyltransferase involved in cell wall biosynthesis
MTAVAVIIPTYNRAHQIADTIRSVLGQSHPPAEVIVVDDGSTDATADVCAPFAPAVRYERQVNAGVSAARNRGVALTSAELVAFVDSDDLWHRDKLALQVAALAAEPAAGWSITGCDVIGLEGAVIPSRRGFPGVFGVFEAEGLTPARFFARYFRAVTITAAGGDHRVWTGDAYVPFFLGNFALPSSAVIRRDVFDRVGGFDPGFRLAEETEFFHRLAAASPVVILPESLVGYRVGQAGSLISPANTGKLIANALTSLERAAALRPATAESLSHFRRGRQALLRKLAYLHLSLGEGAAARRAMREAWRAGARLDAWSLGVCTASLLPAGILEALRSVKAAVRR